MQLAATCIAAKDLGGNNAECLYIGKSEEGALLPMYILTLCRH